MPQSPEWARGGNDTKREYTVTLSVKATFKRRPKRSTVKKEAERMLRALKLKEPWAPAGFELRSRALVVKAPKVPDAAKEAQNARKAETLAKLNEIAADLAKCLGNVKKPRVRWRLNRWCDGVALARAHVHKDSAEVFHDAIQKYVLIPRGLICVNKDWVLENKEPAWTAPENWPSLLAHEIMHVQIPSGGRNRAVFEPKVAELLQRYADFKAGKWSPPVRKAPIRSGLPGQPKPDPNLCPVKCKEHGERCHVKKGTRAAGFEPHEHWHMVGRTFEVHSFDNEHGEPVPEA